MTVRLHRDDDDGGTVNLIGDRTRTVFAVDPGTADLASLVVLHAVHREHDIGLDKPIPLCWFADLQERLSPDASPELLVEGWALSLDHGAVPAWAGTDAEPTCQLCLELVHA